jgi:hypothetical protein
MATEYLEPPYDPDKDPYKRFALEAKRFGMGLLVVGSFCAALAGLITIVTFFPAFIFVLLGFFLLLMLCVFAYIIGKDIIGPE